MHDFEERSKWTKAPILTILAAGLVTGGALEMMANAPGTIPDAPSAVAEPTGVVAPEAPQEFEMPPPPEPARPDREEADVSAAPTFTPFTIAPSITNREEVITAMKEAYPASLRDQGIGGTVRVYFFIDAVGEVGDVRIDQTSGNAAIDEAAMSVANAYRFSPAKNKGEPVPVWVSFPITFQVR